MPRRVAPTELPGDKCETAGVMCLRMDFKWPGCLPICKLHGAELKEGADGKALKCSACVDRLAEMRDGGSDA